MTADFLEIEDRVKEQAFTLYNFKWKPDAEVIKYSLHINQLIQKIGTYHISEVNLKVIQPGPEVIKLFILNSAEHEIYPASKS